MLFFYFNAIIGYEEFQLIIFGLSDLKFINFSINPHKIYHKKHFLQNSLKISSISFRITRKFEINSSRDLTSEHSLLEFSFTYLIFFAILRELMIQIYMYIEISPRYICRRRRKTGYLEDI